MRNSLSRGRKSGSRATSPPTMKSTSLPAKTRYSSGLARPWLGCKTGYVVRVIPTNQRPVLGEERLHFRIRCERPRSQPLNLLPKLRVLVFKLAIKIFMIPLPHLSAVGPCLPESNGRHVPDTQAHTPAQHAAIGESIEIDSARSQAPVQAFKIFDITGKT